MKAVSIISLFIIFISVFGITITYISFQTISPTITDFGNSINTVKVELEDYISSTIDNTSQSLDSASKSLESASASTYLAGKTAYQASEDFGKISKILSTITFGLFDPAKKYEETLNELGEKLKTTGENLNLTAQNIKSTKKNIEKFKQIEVFTKFLEDTSGRIHALKNNIFFVFAYLFLQQFVNLLIGISLYVISHEKSQK